MKVTQTRKGSPSPMKTTQPSQQPPPAPVYATPAPSADELLRRAARVAEAKRKFDDLEAQRTKLRAQLEQANAASAQASEDLHREESALVQLARA